jgi:RNA polymerase sigma factor (sigma-70 family)
MNEVTRVLQALAEGDARAGSRLLPLVYDELRRLAAGEKSLAPSRPSRDYRNREPCQPQGSDRMTKAATSTVLQVLRRAVENQRAKELPDQDLLQQFVVRHDEAAFLALLRRHGPMVLGVCRALLPNEADAEDAFQATFLTFVRTARSIRKTPSLGSWLRGVAYRTACRAQTEFARRHKHERLAVRREATSADDMTWPEVQQVLHEELSGLSERYRAPLTLHYLQGKTLDESAAQLGLAKSTLKARLERGRAVLRARLVRRGLGSAGVLLAAAWPTAGEARLPAVLLGSTTSAALSLAAGQLAPAAVSAPVAALTEGVLKAMRITKLKMITAVVTVLALAGLGLGWLVYTMPPDPPHSGRPPSHPRPPTSLSSWKRRSPALSTSSSRPRRRYP